LRRDNARLKKKKVKGNFPPERRNSTIGEGLEKEVDIPVEYQRRPYTEKRETKKRRRSKGFLYDERGEKRDLGGMTFEKHNRWSSVADADVRKKGCNIAWFKRHGTPKGEGPRKLRDQDNKESLGEHYAGRSFTV